MCLAVRNRAPALEIITCIAETLRGFMRTSCFMFSLIYEQCLKVSSPLTLLNQREKNEMIGELACALIFFPTSMCITVKAF